MNGYAISGIADALGNVLQNRQANQQQNALETIIQALYANSGQPQVDVIPPAPTTPAQAAGQGQSPQLAGLMNIIAGSQGGQRTVNGMTPPAMPNYGMPIAATQPAPRPAQPIAQPINTNQTGSALDRIMSNPNWRKLDASSRMKMINFAINLPTERDNWISAGNGWMVNKNDPTKQIQVGLPDAGVTPEPIPAGLIPTGYSRGQTTYGLPKTAEAGNLTGNAFDVDYMKKSGLSDTDIIKKLYPDKATNASYSGDVAEYMATHANVIPNESQLLTYKSKMAAATRAPSSGGSGGGKSGGGSSALQSELQRYYTDSQKPGWNAGVQKQWRDYLYTKFPNSKDIYTLNQIFGSGGGGGGSRSSGTPIPGSKPTGGKFKILSVQ